MRTSSTTVTLSLATLVLLASTSAAQAPCATLPDERACQADVVYQGIDDSGHLGQSVAGWGDWDNDGNMDMAFGGLLHPPEEGCPTVPIPDSARTKLWISFGCEACICTSPGVFCQEPYTNLIQLADPLPGDTRLGYDACFVGDLDLTTSVGHEIAVSAPTRTITTTVDHSGTAYVLFLRDRGALEANLANQPFDPETSVPGVQVTAIRIADPAGEEWFGLSIAGCGNVIGDPTPDLLIGAPSRGQPLDPAQPAAYVVDGRRIRELAGLEGGPAGELLLDTASHLCVGTPCTLAAPHGNARKVSGTNRSRMGYGVSGLGDLNQDGWNEIALGAPEIFKDCSSGEAWKSVDPDTDKAGYVLIVGWNSGGVAADPTSSSYTPYKTILGKAEADFFGRALSGFGAIAGAPSGDVDGDAIPDLLIGAPFVDRTVPTIPPETIPDVGEAYVISGASFLSGPPVEGIDAIQIFTDRGILQSDWFGWSVAGGGHLNLDYLPEFAIGSRNHSERDCPFEPPSPPCTAPPGFDCDMRYDGAKLGRVVVYCGSTFQAIVEYVGEQYSEHLGYDIAWLGYFHEGTTFGLAATGPGWATYPPIIVPEVGRAYVWLHSIP